MVEEHILGMLEILDAKQSVLRASQTAASKAVSSIKEYMTKNEFSLTERAVEDNFGRKEVINKRAREEQLLYHSIRAQENKDFLMKIQREKDEREKKERIRQEISMKRVLEDLERDHISQQESLKFLEEQKQLRMKEAQEKAQQRKTALQKAKMQGDKDFLLAKNTIPLYQKIEERYRYEVAMPQIEKHKEELAKKREQSKLESIESLRAHAKKHDNLVSQNKISSDLPTRLSPVLYPKSSFMINVLNEDKEKNNYGKEKESERKKLIQRQKHYSGIVKEMFVPRVNRSFEETTETKIQSFSDRASYAPATIPKRNYKRNSMIPSPLAKPQPSFYDYLAERRGYRQKNPLESFPELKEQLNSANNQDITKLKKISKKIEDKTRATEGKYGIFRVGKPEGIKKAANLNNMIISSIRAKLTILESLQN